MTTGLRLAMLILLLTSGALAQELFTTRNSKNQKVSSAEAEKLYLSACAVVKREFNRTTTIRPRLTLVLGANTDGVYYPEHEIHLTKWNKYMFSQGVVILAVDDLLSEDRVRLGKLSVTWAEATLDVGESKNTRTKEQLAK